MKEIVCDRREKAPDPPRRCVGSRTRHQAHPNANATPVASEFRSCTNWQMPRKRKLDEDALPLAPMIALVPDSLLCAWREQLDVHSAAEPCWLRRSLLKPGSLVAETVALLGQVGHIAGVEMWAQRRPAASSMHLHFDCDEERLILTRALRCPLRSCVLYATSAGGPTLIMEHGPSDAWAKTVRCHVCWPTVGAMVTFPGDWLHGVVPADCDDAAVDGTQRCTIVLNLWHRRPSAVPALSASAVPSASPEGASSSTSNHEHGAVDGLVAHGACEAVGKEASNWRWRRLTVGVGNRTCTLELLMPPVVLRGARLESFTARLRDPEQATNDFHSLHSLASCPCVRCASFCEPPSNRIVGVAKVETADPLPHCVGVSGNHGGPSIPRSHGAADT